MAWIEHEVSVKERRTRQPGVKMLSVPGALRSSVPLRMSLLDVFCLM